MRKFKSFLIALFLSFSVLAAEAFEPPSKPEGYVTDLAHVFSPTAKTALTYKLDNLAKKSAYKPQMVVLTVPTLDDTPIFTAATDTFKKWKLGLKDKDNGILILLDKKENAIRIEIGYGIEQYMTALHLSDFVDKSKNDLNKGDYDTAINMIVTDISSLLQKIEEPKKSSENKSKLSYFLIALVVILLLSIILLKWNDSRRRERERLNRIEEERMQRIKEQLKSKGIYTPSRGRNASRPTTSSKPKAAPVSSYSNKADDAFDVGSALIGGVIGSMLSGNSGSNNTTSTPTFGGGGGGETGGGGYSDSGSSDSGGGGGGD